MLQTGKNIILASKSPRRQQILKEMGISFEVKTKDIEEIYPKELAPKQIAEYLSNLKATAFENELTTQDIIITADTVVVNNEKVLGKPKDDADALDMLKSLCGQSHQVFTGVTLLSKEKKVSFTDVTEVQFEDMSEEELNYYIKQFNPLDKAGAYGIQDWIGMVAISSIKGSYFNVVGLPTFKLYQHLKQF